MAGGELSKNGLEILSGIYTEINGKQVNYDMPVNEGSIFFVQGENSTYRPASFTSGIESSAVTNEVNMMVSSLGIGVTKNLIDWLNNSGNLSNFAATDNNGEGGVV